MNEKLFLLVAYHKDHFTLEMSRKYFNPIHVGKDLSDMELHVCVDNDGDNISFKNANYNELTALYWAWKNCSSEYIGLMHYRRYFCLYRFSIKMYYLKLKFEVKKMFNKKSILMNQQYCSRNIDMEFFKLKSYLLDNLNCNTIVVPKKIELSGMTVKEHYVNFHHLEDWELASSLVIEKYPELEILMRTLEGATSFYAYNMFVMHRKYFYSYMEWLFDILVELESRVCLQTYNAYQSRIFGFISERLFNLYLLILKNKYKLKIVELDVVKID